jgi:hypothetical protein
MLIVARCCFGRGLYIRMIEATMLKTGRTGIGQMAERGADALGIG